AYRSYQVALIRRDFEGALARLEEHKRDALFNQFYFAPQELLRAQVYAASARPDLARASFASARRRLEELIAGNPDDSSRYHSALAITLAGLGQREDALREANRGVELMPESRDPWRALWRREDLAYVSTMVGQPDEAIAQLDFLLSHAGSITTHV